MASLMLDSAALFWALRELALASAAACSLDARLRLTACSELALASAAACRLEAAARTWEGESARGVMVAQRGGGGGISEDGKSRGKQVLEICTLDEER